MCDVRAECEYCVHHTRVVSQPKAKATQKNEEKNMKQKASDYSLH